MHGKRTQDGLFDKPSSTGFIITQRDWYMSFFETLINRSKNYNELCFQKEEKLQRSALFCKEKVFTSHSEVALVSETELFIGVLLPSLMNFYCGTTIAVFLKKQNHHSHRWTVTCKEGIVGTFNKWPMLLFFLVGTPGSYIKRTMNCTTSVSLLSASSASLSLYIDSEGESLFSSASVAR